MDIQLSSSGKEVANKMDQSDKDGQSSPWTPFSGGQKEGGGLQMSQLSHLLQNGTMGSSHTGHSPDNSLIVDNTSSNGNKDDEEEDDDEDTIDESMDGSSRDPERLKAFNMFVRLFVDENLDRHVPISNQPKEKIQAIIDSCNRQFPEYGERPRKRIRTYLKSCRRTKRSREQAGLDINRPTAPHLTSVMAEQILARACENEAENAKRMRMGMEPVSQPMPVLEPVTAHQTPAANNGVTNHKSEHLLSLLSQQQVNQQQKQETQPTQSFPMFGGASQGLQLHTTNNGNTISITEGGPDRSVVGLGPYQHPLINHKLNVTEMTAVRQLITGYRESAAFLLRSADELENLLQAQNKK